jgi:hypothetical protein
MSTRAQSTVISVRDAKRIAILAHAMHVRTLESDCDVQVDRRQSEFAVQRVELGPVQATSLPSATRPSAPHSIPRDRTCLKRLRQRPPRGQCRVIFFI